MAGKPAHVAINTGEQIPALFVIRAQRKKAGSKALVLVSDEDVLV